MASNIQPTGLDWKNLPQKTTPVSAENLNKMANTIDDLVEAVNPLNTVEANPEGTPTEGLEKVEIDGTLYEVKGGHKILNDSGTTLTQKDNLQFKGVYTQNNGDNTEVDICRTMTKAQMEALQGEALKGFINTLDEPDNLPLTAEWVAYDSNKSVKEKIDDITTATKLTLTSTTANISGQNFIVNGVAYMQGVINITSNITQNAKIGDLSVSAGGSSSVVNWQGLIVRGTSLILARGYIYAKEFYTQVALQSGDAIITNIAFLIY